MYLTRSRDVLGRHQYDAYSFEHQVRAAILVQRRQTGRPKDVSRQISEPPDDVQLVTLWLEVDQGFERLSRQKLPLPTETEIALIAVMVDIADVQPERAQRWLRHLATDLASRKAYRAAGAAWMRLASVCQRSAAHDQAWTYYDCALTNFQLAPERAMSADLELLCGISALDVALEYCRNRPNESIVGERLKATAQAVSQSVAAFTEADEKPLRQAAWQRLTVAYWIVGDDKTADHAAEELLKPAVHPDDSTGYYVPWAAAFLGEKYLASHQYTAARTYLEHARDQLQRQPASDPDARATVLHLLAVLDVTCGQYDRARKHLEEELEIRGQRPQADAYNLAKTHDLLGTAWARMDRFDQSVREYEEADNLCQRQLEKDDTADEYQRLTRLRLHIQLNLAQAHQSQLTPQNLAKAEQFCDTANTLLIQLRAEAGDEMDLAQQVLLLQTLTDHFMRFAQVSDPRRHLAAAKKYAEQALLTCRRYPTLSGMAIDSEEDLAYIARRLGDRDAERQWRAIVSRLEGRPNTELRRARALNNLAECAFDHGMFDTSAQHCAAAQQLLEEFHQRTGIPAPPIVEFNAAAGEGKSWARLDQWDKAAGCLERALAAVEPSRLSTIGGIADRAGFFKHFAPAGELLVECYLELGQTDKALNAAELVRNRILKDQLKNQVDADYRDFLQVAGSDVLSDLRKVVLDEHSLLLYYFLGTEKSWLLLIGDGDRQLECRQLMLPATTVRILQDRYGGAAASLTAGSLTSKTASGLVDLIYGQVIDGRNRGIVLVPSDHQPEIALPARYPNPPGPVELTDVLIPRELRAQILRGQYKHLVIIPDGALHRLPFEALPADSAQKHYLIDILPPISYSPSASALVLLTERHYPLETHLRRFDLLAIGCNTAASVPHAISRSGEAAVDQMQMSPLKWSEQEAVDANKAMPRGHLLTGPQATESELRRRVRHVRILHFAGHAVASNRPDVDSFLALSRPTSDGRTGHNDGFLRSSEIPQLELKGCELVILSACETYRGTKIDLEVDNSLAREFLVYGCRRVIASQWRVDDESTAALMQRFYDNLCRDREVPDPLRYARALRDARQWARSRQNDPYYWAPFVLIGPVGDTMPPRVNDAVRGPQYDHLRR
jgi:CHAT domain-containing protein/tetratricopeptide (TPR) repeat protein